jgi:ATP-dependent DNA helicase RecG
MTAREITELAYRRGDRSAESETMRVECDLLDTATWRTYVAARGLSSGSIAEQLKRVGLARCDGDRLEPTRAAVLLFTDEPGGHLGGVGVRCEAYQKRVRAVDVRFVLSAP